MQQQLLITIGKEVVEKGSFRTSTVQLSKKLGFPQQSISRHLIALEKRGLIGRDVKGKSMELRLTENGFLKLKELYGHLSFIFARKKAITGKIVKGLGEGKFYMGLDGYRRQFKALFSFAPFRGTLNLHVDADRKQVLSRSNPVYIKGFKAKGRDFGGLFAYPCMIEGRIKGLVIVPDRTHHKPNIIEVVAKENLKKALKKRDGQMVNVEVA